MKKIHYLDMNQQRCVSRPAILNHQDPENVALAAASMLVKDFIVEVEACGVKYQFSDIAWYPDIRRLSLRLRDVDGQVCWVTLDADRRGPQLAQAILDKRDEENIKVWKAREEDARDRDYHNTWAKV